MNFQESIDAAIPTPEDYGVAAPIHLAPVGEDTAILKHRAELIRHGGNGVHIGFAGLANIDFALASHASGMVLCDFNRNQTAFWKELFNIVRVCPDAFHAQQVLRNSMRRNGDQLLQFFTAEGPLDVRHGNLTSEIVELPWLRDNRQYRQLKSMVDAGRVCAVTLDCCDSERAGKIRQWMESQGIHASTVYISNLRNAYAGEKDFYERPVESGRAPLEASITALSSVGLTHVLDGAVPLGKESRWVR